MATKFPKANALPAAWQASKECAKLAEGFVAFSVMRVAAERDGFAPHDLKKLCSLGFLTREWDSRGGHRVTYRINPNHPPEERLLAVQRLPT